MASDEQENTKKEDEPNENTFYEEAMKERLMQGRAEERSWDFKDDAVNCTDVFDKMYACFGPNHQWNLYYREGRIDSCADDWQDFTLCMHAKVIRGRHPKKSHV